MVNLGQPEFKVNWYACHTGHPGFPPFPAVCISPFRPAPIPPLVAENPGRGRIFTKNLSEQIY